MRHYKIHVTMPIHRNQKDIEVDISGLYYTGRPAQMYLRNGDPGYPMEDAEVEIISARHEGNPIELTNIEVEAAEILLYQKMGD